MSDQTRADMLEEDRAERRNRWLLTAIVGIVGVAVALAVGYLISENQREAAKATTTAVKAVGTAEQAQAEKYNLAQQVALACAAKDGLDEATQQKLCSDARQVVEQGPQGPQGVPGDQGPQGVPGQDGRDGIDGTDGVDGKDGQQGPAGPAGKDGAIGPQGPAGKDGEPPFSWVVYDEDENVTETCRRSADFDPASPTYTCVEAASSGSVTAGG